MIARIIAFLTILFMFIAYQDYKLTQDADMFCQEGVGQLTDGHLY